MIVVRKGDMLSSLKGVTAGIALSVALFLADAASAGPKEDVAAATVKWAQVIGEGDPDKVLPYIPTTPFFGERCRRPYARIVRPCGIILWEPSRLCRA
jgi:hypothetical protein